MAETMVEERESVSVLPWEIEADGPRNDDLLIQCIPGCKLRSAISGMRTVINDQGDEIIPVDQARSLADFPKTPGMRLRVNPADLTYRISDPMYGDEEMCSRTQRWIESRTKIRISGKIQGIAPIDGQLDAHRMKTLCREMLQLVNIGHVRCVRGVVPSLEDIEDLPGDFLLNPGSRVDNMQPQFEKDWDKWVTTLKGV